MVDSRGNNMTKCETLAGFSVDFLSDSPELLIGGLTSARGADVRPVGPSY